VGRVLPKEIQDKLNFSEQEYFKNHCAVIDSYVKDLDLDLTVVNVFSLFFLCIYKWSLNYHLNYPNGTGISRIMHNLISLFNLSIKQSIEMNKCWHGLSNYLLNLSHKCGLLQSNNVYIIVQDFNQKLLLSIKDHNSSN
jgi:hypothetical protein